jgi:hypothetical protein
VATHSCMPYSKATSTRTDLPQYAAGTVGQFGTFGLLGVIRLSDLETEGRRQSRAVVKACG